MLVSAAARERPEGDIPDVSIVPSGSATRYVKYALAIALIGALFYWVKRAGGIRLFVSQVRTKAAAFSASVKKRWKSLRSRKRR